jgi:hypothetical protein
MFACLALLPAMSALAQEQEMSTETLSTISGQSDLVALVQVADTDYQYTRSFPRGGTAFLRVLIPYKVTRHYGELIEVYEEGLHENECYFPDPPPGEEGRRYLVFLRYNPDRPSQFIGLPRGCALDVLVTSDNGYALRIPVTGMASVDVPVDRVKALVFADRHAVVDDEELLVEERNAWLQAGWLRAGEDGRFSFTDGIPLQVARELIGEENLTLERDLLHPETE